MGKGKTTLACALAEEFDVATRSTNTRFPVSEMISETLPDGKIHRKEVPVPRLVHSLEEFKKLRARKWPAGTAFVIDEGQATINRRDWNSKKNKFFNILMSTGRVFNSYIFITLPFWKVLDAETKLYIDCLIDVKGYDPKSTKTTYTPYFLHTAYDEPVYFRMRKKNGRLYRIKSCTQLPPSPKLFWAQKKKTDAFKMAIPMDMIGRDGSYIIPGQAEPLSKHQMNVEQQEKKALQWFDKLQHRRLDFLWHGTYSMSRIRRETLDTVPVLTRVLSKFMELDRNLAAKKK